MIAITVSTPESIASLIEPAANFAGTKIIAVLAPASLTDSSIVLKTGCLRRPAALAGGDTGDQPSVP